MFKHFSKAPVDLAFALFSHCTFNLRISHETVILLYTRSLLLPWLTPKSQQQGKNINTSNWIETKASDPKNLHLWARPNPHQKLSKMSLKCLIGD